MAPGGCRSLHGTLLVHKSTKVRGRISDSVFECGPGPTERTTFRPSTLLLISVLTVEREIRPYEHTSQSGCLGVFFNVTPDVGLGKGVRGPSAPSLKRGCVVRGPVPGPFGGYRSRVDGVHQQ